MSEQDTSLQATKIAEEVARMLAATGIVSSSRLPSQLQSEEWIDVEEAAKILGYSTSRFYHLYERLGLIPSRTSKRKLRFRRRDVEQTQAIFQRGGRRLKRRRAIVWDGKGNHRRGTF